MESDWPRSNKSHYVTEIVSWLGFADVIFGGDGRQPEIRLRSQAKNNQTNKRKQWNQCLIVHVSNCVLTILSQVK